MPEKSDQPETPISYAKSIDPENSLKSDRDAKKDFNAYVQQPQSGRQTESGKEAGSSQIAKPQPQQTYEYNGPGAQAVRRQVFQQQTAKINQQARAQAARSQPAPEKKVADQRLSRIFEEAAKTRQARENQAQLENGRGRN